MTEHTSRVWIPKTIHEARELKVQFGPDACYVAGSTWLQLAWEGGSANPQNLISLERLSGLCELQLISTSQDRILKVGAGVCIEDVRRMLDRSTACSAALYKACSAIGAPSVRNRATLVGNLCYRRGDSVPLLLALDTVVSVFDGSETALVPIEKWLSKPVSADDADIVESISIPLSLTSPFDTVVYRKVGRRESFSLALVTVAAKVQQDALGHISVARLAIGGGQHIPHRLYHSEAELVGRTPEDLQWARIYESILAEVRTYSDDFGSENYRREVAANLLVAELTTKFQEGLGRVAK